MTKSYNACVKVLLNTSYIFVKVILLQEFHLKGSMKELSIFHNYETDVVKPVMRQKTCNYNKLFGSSARDLHAGRI